MKLTYFQKLSQVPFSIGVGHIVPMTIEKIYRLGEDNYKSYLFYAVITVNKFYEWFIPGRYDEYINASDTDKMSINLFDLVCCFDDIILDYESLFNIFFLEEVKFSRKDKCFNVFAKSDKEHLCGVINKDNFEETLGIIAELCNIQPVTSAQDEYDKIQDKAVKNMLQQIRRAKKKRQGKTVSKEKEDPIYELGNIISVVSAYGDNGISSLNIGKLTVANLYDQFIRIIISQQYQILARNVSVWGDSENKFKSDSYLKNINKQ